MKHLYKYKWFIRLVGGTWYNVRSGDGLGIKMWIRRKPNETETALKKEVYMRG